MGFQILQVFIIILINKKITIQLIIKRHEMVQKCIVKIDRKKIFLTTKKQLFSEKLNKIYLK